MKPDTIRHPYPDRPLQNSISYRIASHNVILHHPPSVCPLEDAALAPAMLLASTLLPSLILPVNVSLCVQLIDNIVVFPVLGDNC